MAVYKTKSGRWEARISYRDDFGNYKSKRKRFDLKREAMNFETEFLKSLKLGTNNSMTYGDLLDLFLMHKETRITKTSLRDQELLLERFTGHLRNKRVISLKRSDFYKVYDDIVASEYSWSRKNRSINLVKAVTKFGFTRHNINDFAHALEPLKKKDGDEQVFGVWTPEHFDLFISKVDNYTLKVMFTTLYMTGLRKGEARALLVSDLDVNSKSLNINKSMRRNTVNRLKTASSRRVVKLDDDTFKMLLPLYKDNTEYLFGDLKPISNSMLQRAFDKAKENLNIPNIRIHDLRHSHISVLINNGANIVAVSKRVGHSDLQTTLNRYTHLIDKSEDELLGIINKL